MPTATLKSSVRRTPLQWKGVSGGSQTPNDDDNNDPPKSVEGLVKFLIGAAIVLFLLGLIRRPEVRQALGDFFGSVTAIKS